MRPPFARLGTPAGLEAWVERILHTGAALTLCGEFASFAELAASTLPAVLAQLGLEPAERAPLDALQEGLRPREDAGAALDLLDAAGIRSAIVTNGGFASTREALDRGGIGERFAEIVSIDEVEAWKPARAPYDEALRRLDAAPAQAWLVAAHAWDVRAAEHLGLRAVWVEELERRWPLPGAPPGRRAPTLAAAAVVVVATLD